MISQYYTPYKGKLLNEREDGFDMSVISLYSFRKDEFIPIFLPECSIFKDYFLGQRNINFTKKQDSVYFTVSPDTLIYSFLLDKLNFKVSRLTGYRYPIFPESLYKEDKNHISTDLSRFALVNPNIEEGVFFRGLFLMTYSKGMNNIDAVKLYSDKITEKERSKFYMERKRKYIKIIDLKNKSITGSFELDRKYGSLTLSLNDSTFVIKPNIAYYNHYDKNRNYL